jgi:hypothetical protein
VNNDSCMHEGRGRQSCRYKAPELLRGEQFHFSKRLATTEETKAGIALWQGAQRAAAWSDRGRPADPCGRARQICRPAPPVGGVEPRWRAATRWTAAASHRSVPVVGRRGRRPAPPPLAVRAQRGRAALRASAKKRVPGRRERETPEGTARPRPILWAWPAGRRPPPHTPCSVGWWLMAGAGLF